MEETRQELYRSLEAEIGNTPLYKIQRIGIPNGNQVFVKEENENPGGSHYDRVFIKLFRHYEEYGKIKPGYTPVVETTSGSAGVSFARLGRLLGYECLVICPEDLPESRLRLIREQGAQIRTSPPGRYVDGSADELREIFLVENKERKVQGKVPYFGLNHTQKESAVIAAESVEKVIDEVIEQGKEHGVKFDLVVAAAGNGTTALGFGRVARRYGLQFVVWEPLGCGVYYDKKFGEGSHQRDFGIKPGELGYHKIYGVHFKKTPYELPNIDKAFEEDLVKDVVVIVDSDIRSRALKRIASASLLDIGIFGLTDDIFRQRFSVQRLPSWENSSHLLMCLEGKSVGRSSAGNIAAVLDLIERQRIKDANILTFFYDDLSRY